MADPTAYDMTGAVPVQSPAPAKDAYDMTGAVPVDPHTQISDPSAPIAAFDPMGGIYYIPQVSKDPYRAPTDPQLDPSLDNSSYDPSWVRGPNMPPHQVAPNAASSIPYRLLAGAGETYTTLGQGIKEPFLSGQDLSTFQQQLAAQRETDQALNHTTAGNLGRSLPYMAASALPGAAGLSGLPAVGARTAIQTGLGAAEPTLPGESRTVNAAAQGAGNLFGEAVGGAINTAVSPFKVNPDFEANGGVEAAQRLQDRGMTTINNVQLTRSKLANWLYGVGGERNPLFGANPVEQGEDATGMFLREGVGVDAPRATQSVMQGAKESIAAARDDVYSRNPLRLDGPTGTSEGTYPFTNVEGEPSSSSPGSPLSPQPSTVRGALLNLQQRVNTYGSSETQNALNEHIDRLLNSPGDSIDPELLSNVRSDLSDFSSSTNASLKKYAANASNIIDNAMESQVSPADFSKLLQANSQYRNLQFLSNSINKDDLIMPQTLYGKMSAARNNNMTVFGQGDQKLWSAAEDANKVLPDTFPNSGTAGRLMGQFGGSAGAGAVYGYTTSNKQDQVGKLLDAAKWAGIGALAPTVARRAVNGNMWGAAATNPFIQNVVKPSITNAATGYFASGAQNNEPRQVPIPGAQQ